MPTARACFAIRCGLRGWARSKITLNLTGRRFRSGTLPHRHSRIESFMSRLRRRRRRVGEGEGRRKKGESRKANGGGGVLTQRPRRDAEGRRAESHKQLSLTTDDH